MTKPLPLGAVRQRPAKSCAACRQAKAKCAGFDDAQLALLDEDLNALAGQRCARCTRLGLDCSFLPSKRKGRPRRLATDSQGEGDHCSKSRSPSFGSPSSEQRQLPSPPETASPAGTSLPSAAHDQLAGAYLAKVNPYAPLLPPTLEAASAYLGAAGPHLHTALLGLLDPRSMSLGKLTPLSELRPTLDDLQAGVLSVLLAYGLGGKETAKERLSWCSQAVMQLGWQGDTEKDYGLHGQNDRFRQLGWLCWKLEIQLAVLTGVRDRVLGHFSPGKDTASIDSLQRQALLLLFMATETSPTDVNEAHHRAQGLITTAHAIYVRAHTLFVQTREEAAFMTGLMASAATIFLLSSSSIFSTFAAPAFACGIDSTSKPPPSSHHLITSAAQQIMSLVRVSTDPAAPAPVHSPFFGCGLLIAVRGLLLSDEGQGPDEGTEREVQLIESVLEAQAAKWEEARILLSEVSVLRRTLLL